MSANYKVIDISFSTFLDFFVSFTRSLVSPSMETLSSTISSTYLFSDAIFISASFIISRSLSFITAIIETCLASSSFLICPSDFLSTRARPTCSKSADTEDQTKKIRSFWCTSLTKSFQYLPKKKKTCPPVSHTVHGTSLELLYQSCWTARADELRGY